MFQLGSLRFEGPVIVVDDLRESCLLGADLLRKHKISISMDPSPTLVMGPESTPILSSRYTANIGSTSWFQHTWSGVVFLLGLLAILGLSILDGIGTWFSLPRLHAITSLFQVVLGSLFIAAFTLKGTWGCPQLWPQCGNHRPDPQGQPPEFTTLCSSSLLSVPPWSVRVVYLDLPLGWSDQEEFLFQPLPALEGVIPACVCSSNKKRLLLTTSNFSAAFLSLPSGTPLGVIHRLSSAGPAPVARVDADTLGDATDLFDWSDFLGTDLQKRTLFNTIRKFKNVWATSSSDLGSTTVTAHSIPTGHTQPIKQAPRRLDPKRAEIVQTLVTDMLNTGVVEPSMSPWASPIVLVRKPDDSFRFCVDYRKLNKLTTADAFPLPNIDATMDHLGGAEFFSTLDLQSGYWQVPLNPEDKHKSAFVTPHGLYQFTRMPFGLSNAPATFQRLMNAVLRGLSPIFCLVYLDDIIIFSKSFSDHITQLETVLSALQTAGLKVKPSKCQFLKQEVAFLGFVVSKSGLHADPRKIEAVMNWKTPTTLTALQTFLGFAGYYRRFVPNFSSIAAPLNSLCKKDATFHWSGPQDTAFQTLCNALTKAPVLAFPDFTQPFLIDTDASNTGLGAVLSQVGPDGKEHPIAFASRSLNPAERNYSVTRRELLAVVWALPHFKIYLISQPFLLRTDHSSLKWLLSFKDPSGQLARWQQILAEFNFAIEHRPGARHLNADGLSRADDPPSSPATVNFITTVDPAQVKQNTQTDPHLNLVIERLQAQEEALPGDPYPVKVLLNQASSLAVENHTLYRQLPGRSGRQLVVPTALRPMVLELAHANPTAGHFGTERTLQRLRDFFYWPGLSTEVRLFCEICPECEVSKFPTRKNKAPLGTIKVGFPLEVIAMDIMGPFPLSKSGNQYVLVIGDYFTKWLTIIGIPDQTSGTVARALINKLVCVLGVPYSIHTDQGLSFENALIRDLCTLLNIKKTKTTPYRPQSDGLVERANRTIKASLKTFISHLNDVPRWDEFLPLVQLAYNSSVHNVTGFTPAFLMFGRELRLPLHLIFPIPRDNEPNVALFVRDLRLRLAECFLLVRQRLNHRHKVAKTVYDSKCKVPVYVINSYVWLHAPPPRGVSPKLHRYWTGPWQIKGITGTTVDLTRVGPLPSPRHMRSTSVHVDRIKPVRGTVTLAPAAPPVSQSTPVEESVPAPFTVNQPTPANTASRPRREGAHRPVGFYARLHSGQRPGTN